jgi:hypothetical protein
MVDEVDEKEPRDDPSAATASSSSTNAETVKGAAKRVKNAKGANRGKKRSDDALAMNADRTSASEQTETEELPAVARAEELMDRAGVRVGQLLRVSGQQLHRTTALAREAVEDFLAEAEGIRRGERSKLD